MADLPAEKLAGNFLEWQLIEDEKAKLADRSKDLFKAMKAEGYDTKAARASFREKRFELDATTDEVAKAEEADAILDLYRTALTNGLAARARPAHVRVENTGKSGAAQPVTDTQEQPETPANEIHERPSINAEAYPEAGPQAEASPAGIGTGTLAGHEGRSEGEAASAGLPTISNPQPSSLGKADRAGAESSPASAVLSDADVPAFLKVERKSAADYRPHCQHPDACGSSNPTGHCYQCRRDMEAAETEAA